MFPVIHSLHIDHEKMSRKIKADDDGWICQPDATWCYKNPSKGEFVVKFKTPLPSSAICYASPVVVDGDKNEKYGAQRIVSVTDLSTTGFTLWNVHINGGGRGWKPTNEGSFFVTVSTADRF